jgi:hypothetical protein
VIPFATIVEAARVASIAIPAAVEFARAIGCVIADCPDVYEGVVLKPNDVPDAARDFRDAFHGLSSKAAGIGAKH